MESSQPDPSAEAILAERARRLAEADDRKQSEPPLLTVVAVKLGDECLGLPADCMKGVYEDVTITPLLGVPAWFAGVAHVRGELISVVHLTHWLGHSSLGETRLVAVLAAKYGSVGVLVDQVVGARDIHSREISDLLTRRAHREHRPVRLVTNDLVAVLDVGRFFEDPDLVVGQKLRDGEEPTPELSSSDV